jgi:hypothetical protein
MYVSRPDDILSMLLVSRRALDMVGLQERRIKTKVGRPSLFDPPLLMLRTLFIGVRAGPLQLCARSSPFISSDNVGGDNLHALDDVGRGGSEGFVRYQRRRRRHVDIACSLLYVCPSRWTESQLESLFACRIGHSRSSAAWSSYCDQPCSPLDIR